MNSIEKIKKAVDYEIKRQLENYGEGIEQKRETIAFEERTGKTIKMREKESGEDYRFIPDPDLPAIKLNEKWIKQVEMRIPEMPSKKLEKVIKKFKVDKKDADILVRNLELVEFAEELAKSVDLKKYISWLTIELLRVLNYNKKTLEDEDVEIKPLHLVELLTLVDRGELTVLKAKQIMNDFVPRSFSVSEMAGSAIKKLSEEETKKLVKQAIAENKKVWEDYKAGKKESLNFLIGCVMKLGNRRADFNSVRKLIEISK